MSLLRLTDAYEEAARQAEGFALGQVLAGIVFAVLLILVVFVLEEWWNRRPPGGLA